MGTAQPDSTAASFAQPIRAQLWGPAPDLELARECGVLDADAARSRRETGRRLRSGAWTAYGDVVVMHNGALEEAQAEWVAVLRSGRGAVLAAASAMRRHGVRLAAPPRPQLIIPFTRTVPKFDGADLRRSRLLGMTEVHPTRQPPQQRHLRAGDLRAAILRIGPVSGRGLMLRTLDDLELGAQTVHEQRFTRALRRSGLPQPDRQVLVQRIDGRYYLDCWWERWRLHVELDGLAHQQVGDWVADTDRSNELEIVKDGRRLRIIGHVLLEKEPHVMDQVRRALVAGGWSSGS